MVDTITVSEPRRYLDRSFLQQKYVEENLSAKEIALLLGCSLTTIKLHLRQFRLTKGGSGRALHREKLAFGKKIIGHSLKDHKAETQVIDSIKHMYQVDGLGPTAIGRILNTMKVPTKRQGKQWDHSIVTDILEREGIYKKSRNSPRKKGNNGKAN